MILPKSSQFSGICRLDHWFLQIINKGVNKTAHRYLHFMTTYGALVPPAYLPDFMSFCTCTWGRYPFAIFCHFWGPSSSHNSEVFAFLIASSSLVPQIPGLEESCYHVGQTVDKDVDKDIYCWQGCSCPTFSGGSCLSTLEFSVLRVNLMAIKAKSLLLAQDVELGVIQQDSSAPT